MEDARFKLEDAQLDLKSDWLACNGVQFDFRGLQFGLKGVQLGEKAVRIFHSVSDNADGSRAKKTKPDLSQLNARELAEKGMVSFEGGESQTNGVLHVR